MKIFIYAKRIILLFDKDDVLWVRILIARYGPLQLWDHTNTTRRNDS